MKFIKGCYYKYDADCTVYICGELKDSKGNTMLIAEDSDGILHNYSDMPTKRWKKVSGWGKKETK